MYYILLLQGCVRWSKRKTHETRCESSVYWEPTGSEECQSSLGIIYQHITVDSVLVGGVVYYLINIYSVIVEYVTLGFVFR